MSRLSSQHCKDRDIEFTYPCIVTSKQNYLFTKLDLEHPAKQGGGRLVTQMSIKQLVDGLGEVVIDPETNEAFRHASA